MFEENEIKKKKEKEKKLYDIFPREPNLFQINDENRMHLIMGNRLETRTQFVLKYSIN